MRNKEKEIEFIRAERLNSFFEDYFTSFGSPFKKSDYSGYILKKLAKKFFESLENIIGEKIYIKKMPSVLEHIPARFHVLLEKMVSEGIMENISYPRPLPDWPRPPAINIKIKGMNKSSGYALNYETAATKAIAECIEWYSLTVCDEKKLIRGTFSELKPLGALNPNIFLPFSRNQLNRSDYAQNRFDKNTNFFWTECQSFPEGIKFLVPAQLIYVKQLFTESEPKILQTSSNGLAAGSSFEMAMVHAVFEAVERDAFLIHWLNKISPPKIDLCQFSDKRIQLILEEYEKYNIDFEVFDITTDIGVPVVLTAIKELAPNRPKLFVSTRSDLDIEDAIFYSLIDGLRAGFWPDVNNNDIAKANRKYPLIENIDERRAFWSYKSRLKNAEFIFENNEKKIIKNNYAGATDKIKLRKIKEILLSENLKVYYADISTPIAEDAGLRVIKALVPGLCYMYHSEHFKCLGLSRLYEAPVRMGVLKNKKNEKEINLIPHPFS